MAVLLTKELYVSWAETKPTLPSSATAPPLLPILPTNETFLGSIMSTLLNPKAVPWLFENVVLEICSVRYWSRTAIGWLEAVKQTEGVKIQYMQ